MASGRLGYSTIPPYSSCVVYCNNSGDSASVSINSQVISASGNTELTVGIGTTTSIVTSGITTVATGATFNNIIGPTFACPSNYDTYCGTFVASQCDTFHYNYIASGPTGIGTKTTFDELTASSGFCCRSLITGEIVNPALRLGNCYYAGISSSNLMGVYPVTSGGGNCCAFIYTEYTAKDTNAAGILVANPCCTCCGVLYCDTCKCSISGSHAVSYDWYAIKCGYGMCCSASRICFVNGIMSICSGDPSVLTFYTWVGCCNQTQCTTPISAFNCCNIFNTQLNTCWAFPCFTCACKIAPLCGCTCGPFLRGVNFAASGQVGTVILNKDNTPQRYTFFPMSYNITCNPTDLGVWHCWFDGCSTFPGSGLINLCLNMQCTNDYGIKWLSYNPTVDCVYFMTSDCLYGGIYSINKENLFSFLCKNRSAGNYLICCGYLCDMTNYFTKVSNIPSAFANSNLCCIKNLYKTAEDLWGIAIKNCAGTCFETFVSKDLINWTNSTCSYSQSIADDNSKIISNSSACDCMFTTCNCFFGNVSCSGITDYKISANNYERTGVVISDGESVVVNNNSCYTMNSQVWGYEG